MSCVSVCLLSCPLAPAAMRAAVARVIGDGACCRVSESSYKRARVFIILESWCGVSLSAAINVGARG